MSQEIDYLILNKCCNFDWGAHDVGRFGIKGGNFRWYKGVRLEGTFLPVGLMWVYYNSLTGNYILNYVLGNCGSGMCICVSIFDYWI